MQHMLRFKHAARISANEALKSLYFANLVDGGETTHDSSLSSLSETSTLSESDHENDDFNNEQS